MRTWNEEWRELRRMVDTHARPSTIEKQVQLLLNQYPQFDIACPTCKVETGPCQTKSGRLAETHSMRLHRAKVVGA
jgi:hypothetical protein